MNQPSQELAAQDATPQAAPPPHNPASAVFANVSQYRLKGTAFLRRLHVRARGRTGLAVSWVRSHRRESAALVILAMMGSNLLVHDAGSDQPVPVAVSTDGIEIDQLLQEFDHVEDRAISTADAFQTLTPNSETDRTKTVFAVRSSAVHDATDPDYSSPNSSPMVRISRSDDNAAAKVPSGSTGSGEPNSAFRPAPAFQPQSGFAPASSMNIPHPLTGQQGTAVSRETKLEDSPTDGQQKHSRHTPHTGIRFKGAIKPMTPNP